jgi:UDP-N-acetylmuramoyl-tripeptide--D-alanyl-D-alanine ligase
MFSLKNIEEITNGKIINGNCSQQIKKYSTSNTNFDTGIFYVPIIFQKQNREKNITTAVRNGAIGFMINKNSTNYEEIINEAKKINPTICILAVEDVNYALYNLGLRARELNESKEVIAITGSYGKSTLTNLISKVLETEMKVLYDFNNDNNNTKWHLSRILQYFENYDIAVLELGTSNFGGITQMSKLVKPSIAVINSIGTAHINNFKTKQNILEEKMHVVDYIKDKKILCINSDDEYLKKIKKTDKYDLLTYNVSEAWDIKETDKGIVFTTKIYGRITNFSLNIYGVYFVRNIILAIKIAELYHIKYENIVKAINNFKPIDGRFKILRNSENITVIDDTYNSCFESVINGLQIASNMPNKRKIAVLGTIGSGANGKDDTSLVHEHVGEYFKNLYFDYLYLIGDYTKHTYKTALKYFSQQNIKRFKDKSTLLQELINIINSNDLVYLKDAGLQEFEILVCKLKEKYNLI